MATLVLQLALFFPIRKFAASEAAREVEACATNLDADRLKAMRTRRTIGDVVKFGVFIFFATFIYKVQDRFFLSIIFFTFILTFLSYFQCFNFAAKREMKLKA